MSSNSTKYILFLLCAQKEDVVVWEAECLCNGIMKNCRLDGGYSCSNGFRCMYEWMCETHVLCKMCVEMCVSSHSFAETNTILVITISMKRTNFLFSYSPKVTQTDSVMWHMENIFREFTALYLKEYTIEGDITRLRGNVISHEETHWQNDAWRRR